MCSLNVNLYTNYYMNDVSLQNVEQEKTQKLDLIESFFATTKKEEDRTTFDETYFLVYNLPQGEEFISGLVEYKDEICETLSLSEDKYNFFACEALALASQETGMGMEYGYRQENTGIGKALRYVAKWWDVVVRKGGTSSSGLTQIKINDFMNNGLDETSKNLLERIGVKTSGVNVNNLYDAPDKAAAATIVILNSISQNYGNYLNMLNSEHSKIAERLQDELSEVEKNDKGKDVLNKIINIYDAAGDGQKEEIRTTLKKWILSVNGSTKKQYNIDSDYNEELNLEKLNASLKQNGLKEEIQQQDLDYIRYYLTSNSQEMNLVEYCAYAWNKGTGAVGMQLDRTLAEKVGILLIDPQDYDNELFAMNVSVLFGKYAKQMELDVQNEYMERIFAKGN